MKENKIVYSHYQKAIFKQFEESEDDILIQATAGAGKSFVITEMAKRARGRVLFLAFNKSIVEELKTKVPSSVDVLTLHSLGMRALKARFGGKIELDKNKTIKFIQKTNELKWMLPKKQFEQMIMTVPRMIDLYRLTLSKTEEDLIQVSTDVGIDFKKSHVTYAMDIIGQLEKYNKAPKTIDFTDMVYLPAIMDDIKLPRPDVTFIDECQDLNNAQHTIVDKLTKGRRAVFVGDEFQAIYGFAGANAHSFNRIRKRTGITELPLSVTYRCPIRVVDHANKVYPIVEPWEKAQQGEVVWGDYLDAQKGDMVICRNLKPLIGVFFDLIGHRKKAYIKGKDIGQSLIKLIQPFQDLTMEQMFEQLNKALHELANELMQDGVAKPQRHPRYRNISEKVGAVKIVSKHYKTVRQMVDGLNRIFAEGGEGIALSTIHKAKGLEADNVYILNKHLIPSKFATTPEQLTQENNLLYVAITRAKKRLIYTKFI